MISIEQLRRILKYDPIAGSWTWLEDQQWSDRNRFEIRIGKPVGYLIKTGYRVISIDGEKYLSSRLAVFYVTGEWPEVDVDHKNRVRNDDRWENLRCATRSQNLANRLMAKSNKSGLKGVSWNKPTGKWLAQISVNGKVRNLGRFINKEDAYARYVCAAREAFGEFARVA